MRNKKAIITVTFFLLIMLTIGSFSSLAAEKVYINGIDADFPPFAYIDENGNPAGFDVESLDWIADEMGFKVKHQPTAWDGIVSSLVASKIDMVYSGMGLTEERRKKIDFSIPYWEINQAVCVREDSNLNIIAALSGDENVVGSQRGCTAAEWIDANLVQTNILAKNNLKLYESFSLAVKDLVNGRLDSAMMDDVMVEDAARKGQPIKIVGIIKTDEIYAVGVRKGDKELKALLDEGITKLRKSPKWDELIAKYLVK